MEKELSNVAKYHCEKCNYAKFYTQKQLLTQTILKTFIHLFIMLGIIFLIFILIFGKFTFVEMLTSGYLTHISKADSSELRHLAINATSRCNQDGFRANSFCYSYEIYDEIKSVRYVPANFYNLMNTPTDTLKYGGDCKNTASLYISMLKSVGFYAQMKCKTDEQHCITVVPYVNNGKNLPYFFVVDLTIPAYYRMENGQNAWDYMEIGEIIV